MAIEPGEADRADDPLPRLIAACIVATLAFWAYSRTLLPGVDLGDSGGFQAAAIWTETSGRESYPLYLTLGQWFIALFSPANPARGLNLFSSLCGAAAAGLLSLVTARVTRSLAGGVLAGLLLAFSHTFWSQAIIAEVYTLHLALVSLCLLALLAFERQPSRRRLAIVCAVYALSFGNHYSMILLLPPFVLFLIQAHPRPRDLFRPATVSMALGIALAGSLLYAGNFAATVTAIDASPAWPDRAASFWFDVTKADWRDSMVLGIGNAHVADRLAMWWWDTRQQFGVPGVLLAVAGTVVLWRTSPRWATLILVSYAISAAFAVTYNVGDVHVFFLPAHFFTAFAAGAALVGPVGFGPPNRLRQGYGGPPKRSAKAEGGPNARRGYVRRGAIAIAALAAVAYAGWRGWDTWPAVDRHDDRRPSQLVARITRGLDARDALLISAMDWQAENALLYSARHELGDLAWTRLPDVLPHLPFLVADNAAIGRGVALTAEAAAAVVAAYGPFFPIVPDDAVPVMSIAEAAAQLPDGTPYVLTVLPATGLDRLNPAERDATVEALVGRPDPPPDSSYQVWAGIVGQRPVLRRTENRPFRTTVSIAGDSFTIRMESWVPADTFRRAGFGRVVRGREPVLTIERGMSLVWFRPDGTPVQTYAAGLYAPRPRFRIPARTAIFALCSKSCGSSSSY